MSDIAASTTFTSRTLPIAAFFGNPELVERVYAQGRLATVAGQSRLLPGVINAKNFDEKTELLAEVEIIFSTWGMPALTPEQIAKMPKLRAVFYAAGSVQSFAGPFLDAGITVVSAWRANAVPVAEYTLSQILLATKGYFRNLRDYCSPESQRTAFRGRGNFGETVALLGGGAIGSLVMQLLRPFYLHVIVFDPFMSESRAAELGVERVSLEDAFTRAYVVSNHLANLPETVGMLTGTHFASMREDATFINTGRGATVQESEMMEVLQNRPDLTALLDVTWPEPPVENSPLFQLPNAHLTTHIAGSLGDEVVRMADYCLEEFARLQAGSPLRHSVTASMLGTMA